MLFWMRRQGRAMKGELERGVDVALAGGSILALAGLAFVSVAREGPRDRPVPVSPSGVERPGRPRRSSRRWPAWRSPSRIGWAIFAAGVRIDLRKLLHHHRGRPDLRRRPAWSPSRSTSSARPASSPNTGPVFDLGAVLPESSPLGSVLAGLFGYRSAPTPLEVVAYLAYLIPVLILFLKPARRTVGRAGPGRRLIAASVRRAGRAPGPAGRRPGRTGRSSRRTG